MIIWADSLSKNPDITMANYPVEVGNAHEVDAEDDTGTPLGEGLGCFSPPPPPLH